MSITKKNLSAVISIGVFFTMFVTIALFILMFNLIEVQIVTTLEPDANLAELSDVNVLGAADGDFMSFDSRTGQWVPNASVVDPEGVNEKWTDNRSFFEKANDFMGFWLLIFAVIIVIDTVYTLSTSKN